MTPVSLLSAAEARRLRGLLFDLDDTVLSHGVLTRAAYEALWTLRDSGLILVAVTGRPSGWGEVLARQWPVAGVIAENGAIHVVRDGAGVRLLDECTDRARRARRDRLAALARRVTETVPEARPTDDVGARRSDYTWDIGERAALAEDRVRAVVAEIEAAGARWTRSSVHLHATFDTDDKASGAVRFCVRELGEDPAGALAKFGFVASLAMGDGFAEIAAAIARGRACTPPGGLC